MTLEQASYLGELIASFGVLISLIYLALQVRQNTDALKLGTAHNAAADLADINLLPAENGDFADIFFRGLQDINALKGHDMVRFYGFFHKYFRTYEDAHYQFTHGALEAEPFEGITNQFISVASLPGAQSYWQERKSWYSRNFQAYVDRELTSPAREVFKLAGT